MTEMDRTRQVPEIVRRNVKQVIQILISKGFDHEQILIKQYLNGEKSQYEFLLPKSRNYRYYTQQLADQISRERQRKVPVSFQHESIQQYPTQQHPTQQYPTQQQLQIQQLQIEQLQIQKQQISQSLLVVGTVQEVSVGAMCELIKELRQNKQAYEPFQDQVYEQQITINLQDQSLDKKIQPILHAIQFIKNPHKTKESLKSPERQTKSDMLRHEFGTQKDGSMGSWGGKKYEGLGMRNQFTNYRKEVSKNFYHTNLR